MNGRGVVVETPVIGPRRNPTADRAISHADRPDLDRLPATTQQLRERLDRAVRTADGRGIRLLAHLLVRTAS
jgi:hypothetical protein